MTGVGNGPGTDSLAGNGLPGAGGGGVRSAGTLTTANAVITDNRAGDGGLGGNSSTGAPAAPAGRRRTPMAGPAAPRVAGPVGTAAMAAAC